MTKLWLSCEVKLKDWLTKEGVNDSGDKCVCKAGGGGRSSTWAAMFGPPLHVLMKLACASSCSSATLKQFAASRRWAWRCVCVCVCVFEMSKAGLAGVQLYVIAAAVDRDSVVKQRGGGSLEHIKKMYSRIEKSIHFFQYLEDAKTDDTHTE